MKMLIELEDTPRGVRFRADSEHNGVLDHSSQSIAFLMAVQLQHRIQKMATTHILQVEDEDDVTH